MNEKLKHLACRLIERDGRLWCILAQTWYRPQAYLRNAYRRVRKDSIFFREAEIAMCSLRVPKKLMRTLELFAPRSVLDLGCGTGQSLDFFLDRGVDVIGVEGSALAISKARHPERIHPFNLNEELDLRSTFDLVWSFEFVEHIHPRYVHNLMKTFANHSNRIVLSAAPPGQGGEGHFNLQPAAYWIDLFQQYGFDYDTDGTKALQQIEEVFSANMLTFRRSIPQRVMAVVEAREALDHPGRPEAIARQTREVQVEQTSHVLDEVLKHE